MKLRGATVPFLLTGHPRSGTTILNRILNTHPDVRKAARPVDPIDRDADPSRLGDIPEGRVRPGRGYRAEFHLAQDRDLWCRLAEVGQLQVLPRPWYAARVLPKSRSSMYRKAQLRLGRLARRAFELRQSGRPDTDVVCEAAAIRPAGPPDERSQAAAFYFIGEALRRNADGRCIEYLRRSVALDPGAGRAWARLAQVGVRQGLSLLGWPWRS